MDKAIDNRALVAMAIMFGAMLVNRSIHKDVPRSDIERLIDEWIHSERDRSILKRRMLDGVRFEPLAEEFELSVRQTKTIVYKATETINRHIT